MKRGRTDAVHRPIAWGPLVAALIVGSFLAGAGGGALALGVSLSPDRWIALVSSLGTCAAAVATFLTLREMRAGRILNARARISSPGTDRKTNIEWAISPVASLPTVESVRLLVRNASQGVARRIHARWTVTNPLTPSEIETVNGFSPTDLRISVSSDGYSAALTSASEPVGRLPVSKSDITLVGDLGSGQEYYLDIPNQILNHVMIILIANAFELAHGNIVDRKSLPTISLSFTHDSPYERDLVDHHLVIFSIIDFSLFDSRGHKLQHPNRTTWRSLAIAFGLEFTSPEIERLPTVVV